MIITSNNTQYAVSRHDFKPSATRDVFTKTPWQEGITDGNNHVNVKIENTRVVAIESYTGRVYIVDECSESLNG